MAKCSSLLPPAVCCVLKGEGEHRAPSSRPVVMVHGFPFTSSTNFSGKREYFLFFLYDLDTWGSNKDEVKKKTWIMHFLLSEMFPGGYSRQYAYC